MTSEEPSESILNVERPAEMPAFLRSIAVYYANQMTVFLIRGARVTATFSDRSTKNRLR